MSTTLDAYFIALTATLIFGSMGTIMKLSEVSWSMFFLMNEVGLGVAATITVIATGADLPTTADLMLPLLGGVAHCVGIMCFLSAVTLMGVIVAYPAVIGLETTIGTWLLYAVAPTENDAGLLFLAMAFMVLAITSDVFAQLQLTFDDDAATDIATTPKQPTVTMGKASFPTNILIDDMPQCPRGVETPLLCVREDPPEDDDDPPCLDVVTVRPQHQQEPHHFQAAKQKKMAVLSLDNIDTKASAATKMGMWRAIVAGTFLAAAPVFESIAVGVRGMKVATYLPLFAAGSVGTACIALPCRVLYLRRPGSTSQRRHFDEPLHLWVRALITGMIAGSAYYGGAFATYSAGNVIGNTTAVTIQRCNPLVATMWGVLYWRETQYASDRAVLYVAGTILAYLLAVAAVTLSDVEAR